MALEVKRYSVKTLKRLLRECSGATIAFVDQKLQSRYFENYFEAVKAKTVVVERDYTDRDFLEDFASYYVRCFQPYKKTCTRLHFFSNTWKAEDLENLLTGKNSRLSAEQLQSSYLGFTVVKPLPQTFLGKTCLSTYDADGGRRFYVSRHYDVSLYGIKLFVRSLAFQEQDTVAGACATSALWSVFQGTGDVFHHHIPSPVEVSNYADHARATEARRSPSRGLTDDQAFEAIRQVGLEPIQASSQDRETFARTAYAYLKGQVPSYLRVEIFENEVPDAADLDDRQIRLESAHAMAVVGYSLGLPAGQPDKNAVRLTAYRMDKIYVHDDQVGPFARASLVDRNLRTLEGSTESLFTLETSWPIRKLIVPHKLILPLYHKIRIPFSTAYSAVAGFDRAFKAALAHVSFNASELEWDIFLTTANREKEELLHSPTVSSVRRLTLLTQPMPRFLWKARLLWKNSPCLTVLLDATDIEQGQMVSAVWPEEGELIHKMIKMIAVHPETKNSYQLHSQWRIWEAMAQHLK